MTKAKSKTTEDKTQATDATSVFNSAGVEVWQNFMQESARFMTERLQKDMETQQALLRCKTPAELLELQADFYQRAMSDYTSEATRVLELMTKASGASRKYDDVPL